MAEKWINVVLDLNGILCVCEDWKSKGLSHKKLRHFSQPHSATEPALVGPKAVWVCQIALISLQSSDALQSF